MELKSVIPDLTSSMILRIYIDIPRAPGVHIQVLKPRDA
jgi:hypothetical protein